MGGVVIVVLCIVGAIIWGMYAGKKRRDAMTLLADELGLRFSHERNYHLAEQYEFLDRLDQGSNRYAYNVLSGTYKGYPVTAFDYHYETRSRDSDGNRDTDHHHFSFFILTLERHFPELTIAKEGFLSKIAQAVGYADIDFEDREFSRRFVVRSKNEKFACDFCHAPMIEYLLCFSDINLELDRNTLTIGLAHCLKVEEIQTHLDQLIQFRALMPDHLFED